MVSQNRLCEITYYYVISLMILWKSLKNKTKTKIDFVISLIWFCDITKWILWYQKVSKNLWYHEIDLAISHNLISDITKSETSCCIQNSLLNICYNITMKLVCSTFFVSHYSRAITLIRSKHCIFCKSYIFSDITNLINCD